MDHFDCVVFLGDSWTWGAELEESHRETQRFSHAVAEYLDIDAYNLAVCGATNACYKWHWINWLHKHRGQYQGVLVIVNITGAERVLLHDNQSSHWQSFPGMLADEQYLLQYWKNIKQGGGYFRATSIVSEFATPHKQLILDSWLNHVHSRRHAETQTIWELKLLDSMISDSRAVPLFWNAFYEFAPQQISWANTLGWHDAGLDWRPGPPFWSGPPYDLAGRFFGYNYGHPNQLGHTVLAQWLIDRVRQLVA